MAGGVIRTRFAPSPTGLLHLGHAFSALTAAARADVFLLRIEDIDTPRCKPEFEAAIHEDLRWLGLRWPETPLRQSDRRSAYDAALARLAGMGLTYPCRCTRGDIREALSAPQGTPVHGPDGLVYPGTCRNRPMAEAARTDAIRLNMARALDCLEDPPLRFVETGLYAGVHTVPPAQLLCHVGDVVLARRDIGISYHMAVVVDDACQRIDEVVRGQDLFEATQIHVLLQTLLDLPTPRYHHHRLITDAAGRRLAKRDDARAIARYRAEGATPGDIRRMVGL
ncbi:glutamyl-Q tRNA(Asp) synthetase [Rhodovulum imhoffii]|uniref:Glutamyl-Q tRNA(Asp) synthetase n=1 Tax=Rhodovulum imhoffii TaxID=365340 RepID=A0A2T5BTL5_9RHOB|nr:tRNA glutamyl-Q(34) synthetase GluQRS [Rhodovulum imhoffii]MBK5934151.1 tRNA glutamyl-Q(34) synthetase GluQRS [Rhodovulum imhoffii]PTN02775.1 glutamyl-Q tRNA(Asp) synthetase [Rhodovulum imhoffii]